MLLHFYHFLATVTDIWCNVLKLWVMKNIFVVILHFYLHDILGNLLIKLSWSCYNNPFLAIWIIRHPLTTYKMFAAQLAFSKKLLALLSFFIFKACYYFIFSLFLDWSVITLFILAIERGDIQNVENWPLRINFTNSLGADAINFHLLMNYLN